jgi:hypothetical protein
MDDLPVRDMSLCSVQAEGYRYGQTLGCEESNLRADVCESRPHVLGIA